MPTDASTTGLLVSRRGTVNQDHRQELRNAFANERSVAEPFIPVVNAAGGSSLRNLTALKQESKVSDTGVSEEPASEARRIATQKLLQAYRPAAPETFRISGLNRWTGRIVHVEEDMFTAELTPAEHGPTVLGDFSAQNLAPDTPVVGDLVYVTARLVVGPWGFTSTTAGVRLRRLGRWSQAEVDSVESRAEENYLAIESLIR